MGLRIYRAIESPISFKDSGGSAVITFANLAADGLRISARYDRGAGSKPYRYKWIAVFQWTATPVVGEYIDIFISESDGTSADGNVGVSDAAATWGQLWNSKYVGCVHVQTAAGATNNIASGLVTIWDRYFSVGVINQSTKTLQNTANASCIIFTPVPEEIQ